MKGTKKTSKEKIGSPFILYKGKPLVRCGNVIYYGSLNDRYVVKMEIKNQNPKDDLQIASRVTVEMMETNTKIADTKKIVKTSEKNGLYAAIDIADAWLSRAENISVWGVFKWVL